MTDTKKCPSCNEDVPVLAVRCKSCGVRLSPPVEALFDAPDLSSPPDEPSMIADLDELEDLDSDLDLDAGVQSPAPRMSAPPPARPSVQPGVGPSVPPPASISSAAPPPPASVSAPPPPASVSVPPPPASVSAPPPPRSSAPPPPAPSTPPGSPNRTLLGMAPPAVTPPTSVLPPPGAPVELPPEAMTDSGLMEHVGAGPMPSSLLSTEQSLLGADDLDSLDLDDDLLDDDLEEISKFTEQTAITDVSTLAQGMAEEEDEDELPAGLLEDILEESVPEIPGEIADASAMQAAAPPTPVAGTEPLAGHGTPFGDGNDTGVGGIGSQMNTPAVHAQPMPTYPPAMRKQGLGPAAYGVIALFALLGVGTAAYVVLSGDDEEGDAVVADKGEDAPDKTAAEPDRPADEAKAGSAEAAKEGAPAAADEKPVAPSEAAPATVHTCKPIGDYPAFPWSDKLKALVSSIGKGGICGLFGATKEAVATTLRGGATLGPTGYDLLPGGALFEVFPLGKAKRRSPTIEYIFVDDTLFEIRLKYQMSSASDLEKDMFASVIGRPKKVKGDPLDREIRRYTDGDMTIEWIRKEDAFKRVFNEIVFASKLRAEGLKEALDKRAEAMVAFEQGMASFNQKKPMRAIDLFRRARRAVPAMGKAYIFEGITALQSEDFGKAVKAAESALEKSTDDRAKAGAKGLLAVAALFKGEKDKAAELFKSAAILDPADPEFSTSKRELQTGDYDPARVAKTAARMSCKVNKANWTNKGLLARGNFPDNSIFQSAKRKVRRSKAYKDALAMWTSWECK